MSAEKKPSRMDIALIVLATIAALFALTLAMMWGK